MPMLQKRPLSSYSGQYIVRNEKERFELFAALIPLLKELEDCMESRDAAKNRIAQAKSNLEMPIVTTLANAVVYTVIFAIPFLIIFILWSTQSIYLVESRCLNPLRIG